ncbi:MAG: beta-galactosidase, partial [Anaerolineae bacterium]
MLDKLRHPIIMGSQYYRAPTPDRSEWRRDLAQFAALGLNTIKIWAQWRWNNPEENEFIFDDVLELLEIAEKNGLQVVINTISDVA